jgi:subtilisin family serine protease
MGILQAVVGCALCTLLFSVAQPAEAQENRYIIASDAPLTSEQVAALQAAGANVRHVYVNFGGAVAIIGPDNVDRVRALPFVTAVDPDAPKQLHLALPPAPLSGAPYWHDLVDAENNSTYDGSGVWVAVLDSGFYPNWRDYLDESRVLTELGAAFVAVLGNAVPNQWDAGSDPHGMAVAATIIGHKYADALDEGGWGEGFATGAAGLYAVPGIAPGAKVIPVKVCDPTNCWTSAMNAGYDYVTGLKLANPTQPIVINISIGGPTLERTEKAALDAAIAAGVVIVASAGNEGDEGMGFPAAYEPVISVGAGGWTGQWTGYPDKTWWLDDVQEGDMSKVFVANFSSRALQGQYLDVVSAGRFLLLPYPCAQLYKDGQVTRATQSRVCAAKASPNHPEAAPFEYLFMSGTSFSSPMVAGIVALMLQKNPSLSNADAAFGTLGNPGSWGPGALERLLEGAATAIAPGSVTLRQRTGELSDETWGANATGHGWIFVDPALAAVPAP